MKLETHQTDNQTASAIRKEITPIGKIGQKANKVTQWFLKQGYNALFGTTITFFYDNILSRGTHIRLLNNFLFRKDLLQSHGYTLKSQLEQKILNIKASGKEIPNIDSSKILNTPCPKEEYLKQLSIIYETDHEITDLTNKISQVIEVSIFIPTIEELFYRELIQNILLKKIPGKIIRFLSPKHASIIDHKIYTAIRIILSSYIFSASHYNQENINFYSNEYVRGQVITSLFQGIVLGILKETHGIIACISAHAFNNFIASIPNLYAEC